MIMIDPIAALEAVNKAVKLVKMASKTATDVAQLGPLLGNYFEAKGNAIKAAKQAKKKGGSNLGAATQIEMAIKAQEDFERQLNKMFFESNNMDVWHKIKKREAEMNAEDKADAEHEKALEIRRAREAKEMRDIGVGVAIVTVLLGGMGWFLIKVMF